MTYTDPKSEQMLFELPSDGSFASIRLDRYLNELHLKDYSRTFIQKLIKQGNVTVNGKPAKASLLLVGGERLHLTVPLPENIEIEPQNIPLDILYEDDEIIVINKPKDMVVHPAPGHYSGTIVNALLYHCRDNLSGINGLLRPGIVHRIDKDTTGVIVVCKNDKAHHCLAEQLKEHSIHRTYQAIVMGHVKQPTGTIEGTIGRHPKDRKKMALGVANGKQSVTHYKVLSNMNGKYTHILCELETGRTHQIRVHMASIHHPILGDTVYGPNEQPIKGLQGQTLHADTLGFIHPTTQQYVEFHASLPDYFEKILSQQTPQSTEK